VKHADTGGSSSDASVVHQVASLLLVQVVQETVRVQRPHVPPEAPESPAPAATGWLGMNVRHAGRYNLG
jgi:hypothetical protein